MEKVNKNNSTEYVDTISNGLLKGYDILDGGSLILGRKRIMKERNEGTEEDSFGEC